MATAQPITISTAGPFPAAPNPAPNPANPQAVAVTLNPLPAAGSRLTFQLVVTDNLGQTATTTATVTMQGAPTVTITPPTQAAGNAPFTLTANAASPGGTIDQYTWTLTSVTPPSVIVRPPVGNLPLPADTAPTTVTTVNPAVVNPATLNPAATTVNPTTATRNTPS